MLFCYIGKEWCAQVHTSNSTKTMGMQRDLSKHPDIPKLMLIRLSYLLYPLLDIFNDLHIANTWGKKIKNVITTHFSGKDAACC